MNTATEVAKRLMQIKAIKLSPQSPFTWASGLRSPIYCDNRLALSHPDVRSFLIDAFVEKAAQYGPLDGVAGVATAGIPHGALVADRMKLPFIYVRSAPKGHGRQNRIEGEVPVGSRLLVIEDLISTGGSCLSAVEALRAADYKVAGVLAIFSYGFSEAQERFAAADCRFDTLSNYEVLLQEATNQNYIKEEDLLTLQEWQKSPKAWSKPFEEEEKES